MKKILFINACVRSNSRTKQLAAYVLGKLDGEVHEFRLEDMKFPEVNEEFLAERERKSSSGELDGEMFVCARALAEADEVVIAAPYWDLSFPASLKAFFEQANVLGVTFEYSADGRPVGLCRADRLIYVTTAGGSIFSDEYGFGYVRTLAAAFYGIGEIVQFKAEGLDIYGADVESILAGTKQIIDEYFREKRSV